MNIFQSGLPEPKIIIIPAWVTEPKLIRAPERINMTRRRRAWNRVFKWKHIQVEVTNHPIMQTKDLLIMTARTKAKLDDVLRNLPS